MLSSVFSLDIFPPIGEYQSMMIFKTHRDAVKWIEDQIELAGGPIAFAREKKFNPRTIYDILNGKSKTITAKVAKRLGITLAYGRKEW